MTTISAPSLYPTLTLKHGNCNLAHNIFTLPNLLTMGRLGLSPLVLTALLAHHYTQALWIFLAASLTDLCDGWLARILHQKSKLGRYLDPIADKLLVTCVWIGFLILGWLHPFWGAVLICRDFLVVIGSLILYTRPGFQVHPLQAGKVNTVVQVIFITAMLLFYHSSLPSITSWLDVGLGLVLISALYSGYVYSCVWFRHRTL